METGHLPALAIVAHGSAPHWMGLLCPENQSAWSQTHPTLILPEGSLLQERNTSLLESIKCGFIQ